MDLVRVETKSEVIIFSTYANRSKVQAAYAFIITTVLF